MRSQLEEKAINAMAKLLGNKYTLQATDLTIFQQGYIFGFRLSNGDQYIVKVWDDNSEPQIFKSIS